MATLSQHKGHNYRSSNSLDVPARINKMFAFRIRVVNSWNSLPPEIDDTPFMQAFKSRFNTSGEDKTFLH